MDWVVWEKKSKTSAYDPLQLITRNDLEEELGVV